MRGDVAVTADGGQGRVLLVAAAAGYGKTSAVRSRLRGRPVAWHSGPAAAAFLRAPDHAAPAGAAADAPAHWLVFDDPPLSAPELGRLLADAVTAWPWRRIAVITRNPPEIPAARWRANGLMTELGPADLALSASVTARTLRGEYGIDDAGATEVLARATAGWPALVHLAGQALTDRSAASRAPIPTAAPRRMLDALTGPESAMSDYLMEEVWAGLTAGARRLLDIAAHVGPMTSDLAEALGVEEPAAALAELARSGLAVPAGFGPARHQVVPLLAAVVRGRRPQRVSVRQQWSVTSASWLTDAGWYGAAAEAHRAAGNLAEAARLLDAHGPRILAGDGMQTVIDLVQALPEELRTAAVRQVYGEALALTGDTDGARVQYRRLLSAEEADGTEVRLPPGLARRLGYLDYRAGDPQAALKVYARGLAQGDGDGRGDREGRDGQARHQARRAADGRHGPADEHEPGRPPGPAEDHHRDDRHGTESQNPEIAMLIAWTAVAHWAAGDSKSAASAAEQAHGAALTVEDYRPTIAAHVALGLTAEIRGEAAAEQRHFAIALEVAAAHGDVVQEAMTGNNHAARLLGEGRLAEALAAAERSVYLSEAIGLRAMLGMALNNAGGALRQLGRLDEALDHFERAVAVEHRVGSSWLAYPLVDIGDIHRLRGDVQLARAAYDEAVRIAGDTGDRYGLVPGLAGLALVLADHEPLAAETAARRALALAEGPMRVEALLAVGHAARGGGDKEEAARISVEAAEQARLYRDRPRLAHALELSAVTGTDPRTAARDLNEALRIWQDLGATLDADRLRALLGARPAANAAERVAARLARERLAAAGIPLPAYAAAHGDAGDLEIRALGRLTVLIGGEPVPSSAWQSRKARDLLRILIARRGRAVPREEIAQLLWGDDDPGPVGHRLSVALSTLRSVLDPGRRHPADHFLIADSGSIALDTSRAAVDVERFLAEADHGLRLRERGDHAQALAVLAAAERAYTGDFLEDEPYDDWTVAVRETARATYLHCARVLAELHRRAGDTDGCLRSLHRVLDKDPYDEQSHREIVDALEAAGAHGEARRARERYAAAMRALEKL